MQISSKAYMDEFKPKQQMKIINKIHHNSKVKDLFVAVFPFNDDGLFEIYEYKELLKACYDEVRDSAFVIGIAKSKGALTDLVTLMIQDAYDNGDVSKTYFREFFKN